MSNKYPNYRYLDDLRKEFRSLRRKILSHPFVISVEKGKAPIKKLKFFTIQQFHIIHGDLRNIGLYISLSPEPWIRDFFLELIQGERVALANLFILAKRFDIKKKELANSEPHAYTLAFTNYFTRLAIYGTLGEICGSLIMDFECWGENCYRLSKGLKKNYGFSAEDTKFLDSFYPIPDQFYDTIIKIMKEFSNPAINRKRIKTAVRLGLDYELMFWDTINAHSAK